MSTTMTRSDSRKGAKPKRKYTAANADRHELYQLAVQNVESEIDFVDETFQAMRKRKAERLREDFCGTGNTSCEWVSRRKTNTAVGLDIDADPLAWGREHNFAKLKPAQRERVKLLERDVLDPGPGAGKMDIVLAMNFSYWLFMDRKTMRRYFERVRESLVADGVFFLDHFGGYEAYMEQEEEREVEGGKFTYIWDQQKYNPISGRVDCAIHFKFKDGTEMRNAFTYSWRLWSLPEIREILEEAGFKKTTVYWEGVDDEEDEEGFSGGNGEFEATEEGTADAGYICYITAEK